MWFLDPYYISNTLLCLIYPFVRNQGLHNRILNFKDSTGFRLETQILCGIFTILFLRYSRYFTSLKKFVNDVFFYVKSCTFIILGLINVKIMCWYLVACVSKLNYVTILVIWILFQIPRYNGPSEVIYIPNEASFEDRISKRSQSLKSGTDYYYLAIFYSNYSEDCIYVIIITLFKFKLSKDRRTMGKIIH